MKVKKYIVKSVPEATKQIRSELGSNAIILSTKQIRSGGVLGLFSKKMFEVIAATDEGAKAPPAKAPSSAKVSVMSRSEREMSPRIETAKPAHQEELIYEIKQMKAMIDKFANHAVLSGNSIPPILKQWEDVLAEQEIDPVLASRLLHEVYEEREGEMTVDYAFSAIRRKLLSILQKQGKKTIQPQTRIVHFVGPTGVGKTTTIAKLAAEQVLKHKRTVGFITSDTYRIAAVQQLKTYAAILNVPLEVVFSPQDVTKAYHNLSDCDLIFMDTAGRNFRNEMFVSELNTLFGPKELSETYLVLSLSTKYNDMKAVTENFSKYNIDKVLFTKMDETSSFGSIVNLVHQFQLPLSYIATGQNVPDDIIEAREEQIVDLILGDHAHE